jgi:hypothetical protein
MDFETEVSERLFYQSARTGNNIYAGRHGVERDQGESMWVTTTIDPNFSNGIFFTLY